jgi:hypothetical protein
MRLPVKRLLAVACLGLLAGCAPTRPVAYKNLSSATELTRNTQDKSGHVPYRYTAPDSDWSRYHSVLIDPVTIYRGPDQQFGRLSDADKTQLANYMQAQFAQALKLHYAVVASPGADTLRIHVTMTGVERTVLVISTVKQLMPVGAVLNTVKSIAGKQSKFMGSITYAVEIYDGASNRLLRAYVSKQYPAAEDIPASLGTLSASEVAIRKGAKALLAQLQ